MTRQLPVRLSPVADELLSSWINRHAAFYAVPPLAMLRHCLPEASSLRTTDLLLSDDQKSRIASMFTIEPAIVHRMTFAYIATRPMQVCTNCSKGNTEPTPILRSELLCWRITCSLCGNQLSDVDGRKLPLLPAVSLCRSVRREAARR